MIGFYGDIIFETSDERILNFSGFQRSATARWASHEVIQGKPASEFLGPDLDRITFTVHLKGRFGVNVQEEMDRWLIKCRAGDVDTLVIGNKALGIYKWKIISVSQMWNVIMNKGEVISADVDIELEEYVK